MGIDNWLLWVGAAIIFGIIEISVPQFGFIFASGAALIASLVALQVGSWEIQVAVFTASLLIGLFLIRPRVIKRIHSGKTVPPRNQQMIGRKAQVIEEIGAAKFGRITVDGEDWAARSDQPISAGSEVVVESADGIVLHVRKTN